MAPFPKLRVEARMPENRTRTVEHAAEATSQPAATLAAESRPSFCSSVRTGRRGNKEGNNPSSCRRGEAELFDFSMRPPPHFGGYSALAHIRHRPTARASKKTRSKHLCALRPRRLTPRARDAPRTKLRQRRCAIWRQSFDL